MSTATWFSSIGVTLLLSAFLGSSMGKLSLSKPLYWLLNLSGGLMASVGAVLLESVPFVILEGTWTVASVFGWWKCRLGKGKEG